VCGGVCGSGGNIYENNETYPYIILTYFNEFLHNKIGTIVSESENKQLLQSAVNLKTGDLIAIPYGGFSSGSGLIPTKWAIYLSLNTSGSGTGSYKIVTLNENNFYSIENVNIVYKVYGTIEQTFKIDDKILEGELLETYTI